MLLEEEKKWLFPETRYLHTTSGIFREMMAGSLPSTLHSLKELALKVTEDYKIYPAHDIIPIQKKII